jgi:polysaccharide biosynthesis protein PelF
MSLFAYDKADRVTSLYGTARRLQIELGCPEEKIMITPNGTTIIASITILIHKPR